MKLNKTICVLSMVAAGFFASCSQVNPLEEEQYIKQVYIVGAYDVVRKFNVPYGDEPQNTYISVATGGSLNVDEDVNVTLAHNDPTITWYNKKYMIDAPVKYRKLENESCDIPSMNTTIKSGQIYSRLPFFIHSSGLHCDSLYALTLKIESTSMYTKHPKDTVLVMNLNFVNEFSGSYQMAATKYTLDAAGNEVMPTSMNLLRTVKAVDKDQVRFFNEATIEAPVTFTRERYFQTIYDNCVVFSRQSDGSFTASGWRNLAVSNGMVKYTENKFEFSYDYVSGGKRFRLRGTMTK